MIKISIVDDHIRFHEIMKFIFNNSKQYELTSEYNNGKEFLKLYKNEADIVLMDIKMPEMDGVVTTKMVVEKFPGIKIIGLSLHSEDEYVNQMKENGALGFVSKFRIEEELEKEITRIYNE